MEIFCVQPIMRVLNVAEKNSVAREICKHLATGSVAERRLLGQSVTEFQYAEWQMVVTAVRGHLKEIDFDSAYNSWQATNPADLFDAPIVSKINADMKGIEGCLKQLARSCEAIILWLDCDREGEAIAFEVLEVCLKANPRLRVMRAQFSALTRSDLTNAVNRLVQPNKHMSEAVLARSEMDLRTGAAFTRFLTMRYKSKAVGKVLSYGPCQFPTLGFIVARWEEILAFEPKPFWFIKLLVEAEPPIQFHWKRDKLFEPLVAAALFERVADELMLSDGNIAIIHVSEQPKSRYRPLPMNTVEMTKLASTKLKLNSHRTMQLAEALYTKGIISYPRTETDRYHASMDLLSLFKSFAEGESGIFRNYATSVLSRNKFQSPRAGTKDDKAHPPIHPCKVIASRTALEPDEWRLYDLIARHFLAQCSPDAKGSSTKVELEIAEEIFYVEGLKVIELNWLEIFTFEKWYSSSFNIPVDWRVGYFVKVHDIKLEESVTAPPLLLSESELIALMDSKGIGTDATMHDHIKTIQDRGYAERTPDSRFTPSKLGVALVRGFKGYASVADLLVAPDLRATMEADTARIASGQLTRADFLSKYKRELKQIFVAITDYPYSLDNNLNLLPEVATTTDPVAYGSTRRGARGGRARGRGGSRGVNRAGNTSFRRRGGRINRSTRTIQ